MFWCGHVPLIAVVECTFCLEKGMRKLLLTLDVVDHIFDDLEYLETALINGNLAKALCGFDLLSHDVCALSPDKCIHCQNILIEMRKERVTSD